ncbi:MAG: hypothetical protein NC485_08225 [Ruminococcus flavefaciens]|nr:hypothetical protein [Ruminococcus flavefaciens]MCM1062127.1 hypothetical protein [Eubacterium sp.]
MWKFLVKQQKIEVLEREVIADHQIAFVNLKFTFDSDWKKFHKVVQFSQCDEVYNIVLGFDGTSCKLPAELHAGAVKMSVFGYDAASDTTVRATTVPITLNIRPSGFVGDDDTPIPPTPDLYTQLLQKIAEIQAGVNGKDGLSAYELAQENGFVGTLAEWLESLKGADGMPGKDGVNGVDGKDGADGKNGVDGRDGKDGETPDMSDYPKTTDVEKLIETQIAPILESGHNHENQDILDSITAIDTHLDEMSSNPVANYVLALAIDVLNVSKHDHSNLGTLEKITEEFVTAIGGLQEFEDSVNREIRTVKESVEPVISQAHWHHNLTLLNSITAAKMAKWDKTSDIDIEFQQFRDSTQYDQQNQNDAILMLENRITVLESLHNNGITLFSSGSDAVSKYGAELFTIYNNAYNSLADFSANYPHFLSADNDYQMHFSMDDFGWDGVVYVVCTKELNLSGNSQISMCYKSGATESGDLYLVPKPEHSDVPISVYVYTQIQNGTAVKIPFQWLYSETFVTTLSDCNVGKGTYYFAFAGRSNNSHPQIKSIKILEG